MRFLSSLLALGLAVALLGGAARAAEPVSEDGTGTLTLREDHLADRQSPVSSGARCATFDFGPADLPRAPSGKEPVRRIEGQLQIPVAFHVVYKEVRRNGRRVRLGDVPDAQLDAQIRVLNGAFAGLGISFVKRSVDRRWNATWFGMSPGSRPEQDCKRTLAVDPARVLNIYTCAPGGGLLGWAYFPWSLSETSFWQGVVLLYSTLPGGGADPYDEGDTAVHEVGHYLGLYHTFQNGCRTPGDYVSDTPFESTPAYGCPTSRNTCSAPGLDPVRNFMDYTDDACMVEFTAGQATRVSWALQRYRPRLLASAQVRIAAGKDGGAGSGGAPDLEPAAFTSVASNPALVASPNPFNPTTTFEFRLARAGHVELHVYDVAGRRVASVVEGERAAGTHRATFEGRGLASGIYVAVLRAGDAELHQRLVLLK